MRLLSWYVNKRQPDKLTAKIESLEPNIPHIVTLQEVKRILADDWAKQLSGIGLVHHYRSGNNALALTHQCLIASCWELTPNDIPRPREPPYPESLGRATVSVCGEEGIDVFTAHIPNGCESGWMKVDTFHVLTAELRRANTSPDSPRILTGDFNEPKRFEDSGQIVTWEEEGCRCDQFGDERPRIESINGVLSVLDGESKHGLRDAYRARKGFQASDLVSWGTRCIDHTFVSRHFEVLGCDYHNESREQEELSDHSPMWAELRLRTEYPESKESMGDCSCTHRARRESVPRRPIGPSPCGL